MKNSIPRVLISSKVVVYHFDGNDTEAILTSAPRFLQLDEWQSQMTLHEMALSGVSNACRSHDECFSSHVATDQFTQHKTKVKYQVHKFSTSRQSADTKELIKSGHKSGHFGTPEPTSTQHKSVVYSRKRGKEMDWANVRDDLQAKVCIRNTANFNDANFFATHAPLQNQGWRNIIVQQCLTMIGEDLSTSNHSACQETTCS